MNSEILYSKPSSWKSVNAKSDESRDLDFIFEDAQHNLNQVYAIKKHKVEKPNAKAFDTHYTEEVRSKQNCVGGLTPMFTEKEILQMWELSAILFDPDS
jgi:hypothetical protein